MHQLVVDRRTQRGREQRPAILGVRIANEDRYGAVTTNDLLRCCVEISRSYTWLDHLAHASMDFGHNPAGRAHQFQLLRQT